METKRYNESRNCIHEINWAYNRNKDFVVLMFERLSLDDIPDVGFLIDPLVRHNVYRNPELLESWSGKAFEPIVYAIQSFIEPNARMQRSASYVTFKRKNSVSLIILYSNKFVLNIFLEFMIMTYFQANHSQVLKKKFRQRSESFNDASIREQTDEENQSNLV